MILKFIGKMQAAIRFLLKSQIASHKLTRFGLMKLKMIGISKLRRPLQKIFQTRLMRGETAASQIIWLSTVETVIKLLPEPKIVDLD